MRTVLKLTQMVAGAVTAALTVLGASVASAQPLRVVRHAPVDSGTPGSFVTVAFNRPVVDGGRPAIAASKVMSVEPALPGVFEWRDRSTLRFLPAEPFAPGTTVTVAVDTAMIASDGVRSGVRYSFSVRIPGARPIGRFSERQLFTSNEVGPLPTFRVMYSAPVNIDTMSQVSRLEFQQPCSGVVQLRAVRQRRLIEGERARYSQAEMNRDTIGDRFRRVVEFVAPDSLPVGCSGRWVVASQNLSAREESFRVYPAFAAAAQACQLSNYSNDCRDGGVRVTFTAPVDREVVNRYVRINNSERSTSQLRGPALEELTSVVFHDSLLPSQSYTVAIDTAIRDVYGRKLEGPHQFSLTIPGRLPGVKQQNGLVAIGRSVNEPPTVTVRTVNVDTLLMQVVAIPDSLTSELLATSEEQRQSFVLRTGSSLRDTIVVKVPVRAVFNQEVNTSVRLPLKMYALGAPAYSAIRFAIATPKLSADSARALIKNRAAAKALAAKNPRVLPAMKITATPSNGGPDLGLIVHVSPLVAHTKISGNEGAVFLTDRMGSPVRNATVQLFGSGKEPIAQTTTNTDGLATLTPTRVSDAATPSATAILRNPAFEAVRYVKISRGRDQLIVPVRAEIPQVTSSSFGAYSFYGRESSASQVRGTVTPDRNLYRPGEQLYSKIFARTGVAGLATTPAGDSVRVVLRKNPPAPVYFYHGPRLLNEVGVDTIARWSAVLNEFGTASDSVQIPTTAGLGMYTLRGEMRTASGWQVVGESFVRIDEFRPPEFLVSLESDSALRYLGDTVSFKLDAKYLFGAPMSGASVKWTATADPVYGPGRDIPGSQSYSIGRNYWWETYPTSEEFSIGRTDTLDRNGHVEIRVPTQFGSLSRRSSLTLSVAVTDQSNKVVTARTSSVLASSDVYIGAKFRGNNWYSRIGVPQTVDLAAFRSSGDRVANIPIKILLLRRHRVRVVNDSVAAIRFVWKVDTISQQTVRSTRDSVQFTYTPALDGAYDVVAESLDSAGRAATTNIGRWAMENGWSDPYNPNVVALRVNADRPAIETYKLGDTAILSFDSPFERADAWITYERESVLEQKRISVARGVTTLRVPVSSRFAPNIWIGVTLFRRSARSIMALDSLGQVVRVGYRELLVDSTAHALRVAVMPKSAQVAPGEVAEVNIKVTEVTSPIGTQNAPREVALWAVDEGLLSMSGFKTPDILNAIDQKRGIGQSLRTTLSSFQWLNPPSPVFPGENAKFFDNSRRLSFAASSVATQDVELALPQNGLRSGFRLTAFYVGSAITDANGVATVRAKLPDNITTFRLMATAIGTGNRYGSGETTLLVTKRIVLRSALPRFVRYGDSLSLNMNHNVRNGAATPIAVNVSAGGAVLLGKTSNTASITEAKGSVERFAAMIPERSSSDVTRVVVTATDRVLNDGDALETRIPIKPSSAPRSYTIVGSVTDSGTITMSLPADIDPTRSTISVDVGTSPLIAIRSHFQRLRNSAYPSTDHLLASARGLLALYTAERKLGDIEITRDSARVMSDLEFAVAELGRRQRVDGSFSYWPASTYSVTPAFTALVAEFLVEAERVGVRVPARMLPAIQQGLRADLRSDNKFRGCSDRERLANRVRVAKYLREVGAADQRVEDSLFNQASSLFWEDRIALAEMMFERADLSETARRMLQDLWTKVATAGKRIDIPDSLRGYDSCAHSRVRPYAGLMRATMKMLPAHPLLGALNESILQHASAQSRYAWNLLDHLSAIEALAAYAKPVTAANRGRIVVRSRSGEVIVARQMAIAAPGTPLADSARRTIEKLVTTTSAGTTIGAALRIENDAGIADARGAPVYYSITVHEIPKTRAVNPDDAGIMVERWYENFNTGAPILEALEGDLVRVHLRVTVSSDRQFVALEDMLPAGLEAVDLTYNTSSELSPFALATESHPSQRMAQDKTSMQQALFGSWVNGELSPWEYQESRDDRVRYFARQLAQGSYMASYVARATTAGKFINPPARAEEMYNAAVQGRSAGGTFIVKERK